MWIGVLAAVAISIIAGLILSALGIAFEGRGEVIFEGIAMLLAAGVLTWMIFWMQHQGRLMQPGLRRLEHSEQDASSNNRRTVE